MFDLLPCGRMPQKAGRDGSDKKWPLPWGQRGLQGTQSWALPKMLKEFEGSEYCNDLAIWVLLVGGLEHFHFFHILGIIIPIDYYFFERLKPPTQKLDWSTVSMRLVAKRFCHSFLVDGSDNVSIRPTFPKVHHRHRIWWDLGGSINGDSIGYPNSWMVYFMDDEWGTPISGKLHIRRSQVGIHGCNTL